MKKIIFILAIFGINLALADIVIGIGGGYKKPLEEIITEFHKSHKSKVIRRYGNMKFLKEQISKKELDGLIGLEQMLQKLEINTSKEMIGLNKLVLVSKKGVALKDFKDLQKVNKILVLDSKKGAFGEASQKFLESLEFYPNIQPKIILTQDLHLGVDELIEGKIDAAFLNTRYYYENKQKLGNFLEIPTNFYKPQKLFIAKINTSKELEDFIQFLKSNTAQEIFLKYGIINK
ncbi:molybdate ABC transporter substrate-binding protein [Helicobacter burdigaliensis]|uniref:molybdate ABC transporter substrate-binding protein n=1 Tax=Helicobacter burdigaliensis TaxID=2315334 RepID=UPI000EF723DB|nr:molybdate ABC transporter substrate-binding protein [Helicobacter burdigaliensis]